MNWEVCRRADPSALRLWNGARPDARRPAFWLLYGRLSRELSRELARRPPDLFRRRLVVLELAALRPSVADRDAFSAAFLDSLLISSLDPVPWAEPVDETVPGFVRPLPLALFSSAAGNAVMPRNVANSCFCDSVIVAMFLATDAYDRHLSEEPFLLPWRDSPGGVPHPAPEWLRETVPVVENSLCYQKNAEALGLNSDPPAATPEEVKQFTLESIRKLQGTLRDLVVNVMRVRVSDREQYLGAQETIGLAIENFRETLSQECGGGEGVAGQEDAVEFYEHILQAGGWLPLHSVTFRTVKKTTYVDRDASRNLFASLIPTYSVHVDLRAALRTRLGERRAPLQELIDAAFRPVLSTDVITPKRDTGVFEAAYEQDPRLRENVAKYPDTTEFELSFETTEEIARLPDDVLVFVVDRFALEEGEMRRVATEVDLPRDGVVRFRGSVDYSLIAVVCRIGDTPQGAHYFLYFRRGDRWYRYDDTVTSPEEPARSVRLTDEAVRKEIEETGTIFWAKKIAN